MTVITTNPGHSAALGGDPWQATCHLHSPSLCPHYAWATRTATAIVQAPCGLYCPAPHLLWKTRRGWLSLRYKLGSTDVEARASRNARRTKDTRFRHVGCMMDTVILGTAAPPVNTNSHTEKRNVGAAEARRGFS